jgi:hypothetical protein
MNISIKKIIFVGLILRICIAIWNGFFGPSPGADLDAAGLNGFAQNVALTGNFDDFTIGYIPYTNILGLLYSWTISHVFIGSVLSCLFWMLSAFLFLSSLQTLKITSALQKRAMWIYAILPSSVMLTAVTLREPYQLFFVTLSIFAILKLYINRSNTHWLTLVLGVLGAGVLHGALLAFGIILLAGTFLIIKIRAHRQLPWFGLLVMLAISFVIFIYGFSLFGDYSYSLDGGLDKAVEAYQLGGLGVDARTHYKTDVSISGVGGFLFFIPISIFQYMFEPMPWRVSTAGDALLLIENLLRAWLIWRSFKSFWRIQDSIRVVWSFTFIAYFILEAIWSLGTINWGTSVRHHIPSMVLLLLAAFSAPSYKFTRKK